MNLLMSAVLPLAEKLLNTALAADPASSLRLKRIGSGRLLAIECSSAPHWQVWVLTGTHTVRLLSTSEDEADCTLCGSTRALASLLTGDARQTLQSGKVVLSGDTTLATDLQALVSDLEIDWQDKLAPLLGDVPTWQLHRLGQHAGEQLRRSTARVHNTVDEFLHEETRWLPVRDEVEQFGEHLDNLRLQIDRLEARTEQLHRSLDASGCVWMSVDERG